MELQYYYNQKMISDPRISEKHRRILFLLDNLKLAGKISGLVIYEINNTFDDKTLRQSFLNNLRDFSMRHHVGLGHIFGSRRYGFTYLPSQFLLVMDNGELREVFPCEINGIEKGIAEFLEALKQGLPWTRYVVPATRKTKHEEIAEKIIQNSNMLEDGLYFEGRNVQVSQDFGELGYIDLIFRDKGNRFLLIEVKVKPEEIDKAIGQIMRHRKLFIKQNLVTSESVRIAIACPYISLLQREICDEAGITCFQIAD